MPIVTEETEPRSADPSATGFDVVARPGRFRAPGERLAAAFDSIESLPAPIAFRDRAVRIAADEHGVDDLATVVGADLGLALAVLRAAGRSPDRSGTVASVEEAIEQLGPTGTLRVLSRVPTFDPLAPIEKGDADLQRARSHALAVRDLAVEIAKTTGGESTGEVAVAALMHDLGRLVVTRLHPEYEPEAELAGSTPEQRLRRERARYGIDHTLVGGVLARRWDLPDRIATAVERHHNRDSSGAAAIIGLADQIAHHRAGNAVSLPRLRDLADSIGVGEGELGTLLSGPVYGAGRENGSGEAPCPLSSRELDALARLSEGKVYKQIADEMGVSVSTVRTHLHNVYGKLEVVDRAQAVLRAREQRWL